MRKLTGLVGVRPGLMVAFLAGAALLASCGQSEKFNRAAFDVCLVAAKKDPKIGNAKFVSFEEAKVTSSTGDDQFRVNIPYELGGQKGLYQCIAEKRQDGSFAAVF